MKTDNEKITYKQLMKVAAVCLYSPILRLIPVENVEYAGRTAWLAAIAAVVPSVLYICFLCAFMSKREPGEGLGDLIIRCIGKIPGKILCGLFLIWFVLYAGFTLRVSSERLVTTIFDDSNLAFISLITIAAVLVTTSGKISSVGRTGEIFLLIISGLVFVVLFLAAKDIKAEYLLPIDGNSGFGILKGIAIVVNVVTVISYVAFLGGYTKKEKDETKTTVKCVVYAILVMTVITFCCVGSLSSPLIAKMQNPFFVMIRNISAFGVLERIESVAIAIWVLGDFLFLAVLMRISGVLVHTITEIEIKSGFYYILGILVFILSFFIGSNYFVLTYISKILIPIINVFLTIFVLISVFLIGKIRGKI